MRSTEPQDGRKQDIPGSEAKASKTTQQQSENIDVSLTRNTASINGSPVRQKDFRPG